MKVNKVFGEDDKEDIHVCIATYLFGIVVDQFVDRMNMIVTEI